MEISLVDIIHDIWPDISKSQARRLIKQGAITLYSDIPAGYFIE
jgi:hypothetical protein